MEVSPLGISIHVSHALHLRLATDLFLSHGISNSALSATPHTELDYDPVYFCATGIGFAQKNDSLFVLFYHFLYTIYCVANEV